MPKSVNEVHIAGHLGKDPEIKYTPKGKLLAKFSIATGGGKFPTDWHNIIAWEKPEVEQLKKGQFCEVLGRISYPEWTDKQGNKRRSCEIVATSLEFEGQKEEERKEAPAPLTPRSYTITPEHPITDEDIPF